MSRDGRVAVPRGAIGLSGFVIEVFPDHTHLLFLTWAQTVTNVGSRSLAGDEIKYCTRMQCCLFCLFDLILYVPSTSFQLNRVGSPEVEPKLSY